MINNKIIKTIRITTRVVFTSLVFLFLIVPGVNYASADIEEELTSLFVYCSASPNPVEINQRVTFAPTVFGGSGSYTYQWIGSCTGYFQYCDNSFSSPGTYTTIVTVAPIAGGASSAASCSVVVGEESGDFVCYNNNLYWIDQYGNRQGIYQDCGDSYCTDTGSNYCVGNSIYRQRTCYNKGCAGNACYSTTSNSDNQFVQTCPYGQTCQGGSCTSTPDICYVDCEGPHNTKKCYNGDLYWYSSSNTRQDKYKDCEDTNECTLDNCFNNQCQNELFCNGATCEKGSTDYCNNCDYCGDGACNCDETIASCKQDCQIIGLALTLLGKRESEAIQWLKSFTASPTERIGFLAVVSNGENITMDNVVVSVLFPQEVMYKGELTLEGARLIGDIRDGITLGSLAPGATKTITFKGEIVSDSSIFRSVADIVGTITTSSGSTSDNIQITLLKEGQQIVSKSEGWIAGLLGINLNKPIYILLIIIVVILILIGLSKIVRGFKQ